MEAKIICFVAGFLFLIINTAALSLFHVWRKSKGDGLLIIFIWCLAISVGSCSLFRGLECAVLKIFDVEKVAEFFWYGIGGGIAVYIMLMPVAIWCKSKKKFETID